MTNQRILWRCRDRLFELGPRTLVMGVLNVTPDSFSDGGRYLDTARAIEHGLGLAREGADILDVGGESTRPGADPVSMDEELARVIPVIEALAKETSCALSIDTRKAGVAAKALAAGACMINDVSALGSDPDMPAVAREDGAGVILMHMRGLPKNMQDDPQYHDPVVEIAEYLRQRCDHLVGLGLPQEALAVDPGIGFGKTLEHNIRILANLQAFGRGGRPVVVGLSRKSFLGRITGRDVEDRLAASLGAAACAILWGAHVIRVHDVKESCDVARVVDILKAGESPHGPA
jgi:dihydropteroate synthase